MCRQNLRALSFCLELLDVKLCSWSRLAHTFVCQQTPDKCCLLHWCRPEQGMPWTTFYSICLWETHPPHLITFHSCCINSQFHFNICAASPPGTAIPIFFRLLFLIASTLHCSALWHQYSALLPVANIPKHTDRSYLKLSGLYCIELYVHSGSKSPSMQEVKALWVFLRNSASWRNRLKSESPKTQNLSGVWQLFPMSMKFNHSVIPLRWVSLLWHPVPWAECSLLPWAESRVCSASLSISLCTRAGLQPVYSLKLGGVFQFYRIRL